MRRSRSRRQQERLRALRVAAFLAQQGRCIYCSRPMWDGVLEGKAAAQLRLLGLGFAVPLRDLAGLRATAEHLVRRADGGRSETGNVVAACRDCNCTRHDAEPMAWKAARAEIGDGFCEAGRSLAPSATWPAGSNSANHDAPNDRSTNMLIATDKTDPASLLNEDDAAGFLGVSERTLQGWRVSGAGPKFVKLGRIVRYRRIDLIDFIDARVAGSTTEAGARR